MGLKEVEKLNMIFTKYKIYWTFFSFIFIDIIIYCGLGIAGYFARAEPPILQFIKIQLKLNLTFIKLKHNI